MGYWERYAESRGEDPDDIRRDMAEEESAERHGAAYGIKASRPGGETQPYMVPRKPLPSIHSRNKRT